MKAELKALIIDDEAMACDLLEYLINKHVPAITHIKKATSATDGLEMVKTYFPDIIFLDIQMPFMNGFELLGKIPQQYFSVIFTTAHNKYAIRAIRFSALDYLLKPVDPEELIQSVDRYQKLRAEKQQMKELYRNFLDNIRHKEHEAFRLALPHTSGLRLASPDEIIHCTGINNYTQFHLTDGTHILVSKTIKEFEELLADYGFIRTHKSHLVNKQHIKSVKSNNIIVLRNGQTVEMARRRQHEVMAALKNL